MREMRVFFIEAEAEEGEDTQEGEEKRSIV